MYVDNGEIGHGLINFLADTRKAEFAGCSSCVEPMLATVLMGLTIRAWHLSLIYSRDVSLLL